MNKSILWVFLLAASLQTSWAFSPSGPIGNVNQQDNTLGDGWQTATIGYGLTGDLDAPKNLGEEYRRTIPVMYYTYDANFFDYFGTSGAASVDSAFVILNALTNVNNYSQQLVEFSLDTRQQNYQAQALGLFDLKTFTLGAMMEQLGLTDPVRYAWTLHDRTLPPGGTCPFDEEYLVVQRNFDFFSTPLNQLQYSPYVNNTLYSYQIYEACTGPNPLALAVPYSVDPLADTYSPVSCKYVYWGDYLTGLTRDDMAGLRYLLSTNNINLESAPAGSLLGVVTTNTIQQQFPPVGFTSTNGVGYYYFTGDTNGGYGYGDLAAFLAFTATNDPIAVQAAYPGVLINSYSNNLVWATNYTYSSYFAPPPSGSVYGTPPKFVVVTNATGYYQSHYFYQFANVFPFHYYTNSKAVWQTYSASAPLGAPYGSPVITNTTIKYTNVISGDFFVLPPFQAGFCPLSILESNISSVIATTNFLTGATTNLTSSTNSINYSNSVALVTFFTNYVFKINPVTCTEATNATGLYQGIGNIKFVRADYDSLIGQYFQPITNYYTMVMVTNSQAVLQHFRRVVTEPDILFSAEDLASPNHGVISIDSLAYDRNVTFNSDNEHIDLAGPGTITSPTRIAFNKVGPTFFNTPSSGMDGTPYFTQTPGGDISNLFYNVYFIWASFDGTTNAPTVYPNGTSIGNLENQVLIQVKAYENGTNLITSLPDGSSGGGGEAYPVITFTATGGSFTQPYTWSAVNLPPGLTLSSGGTLSGVPIQPGTFDFILKLTDYLGRSVQWNYTITIR